MWPTGTAYGWAQKGMPCRCTLRGRCKEAAQGRLQASDALVRSRLARGLDVLIHPEQVVRVELGLDLREPLVVRAVDARLVLRRLTLGHEVHVHAARGMRRHVIE